MNTTNCSKVDQAHLALVIRRNETGAVCDALLESGVAWDSIEYQSAREENAAAIAALNAYAAKANGGTR